jgi:hypothetical protein
MAFDEHKKKIDPTPPVYHAKFADIMSRIRGILKDYQHEMKITQLEKGGVTTSVEVTITLNK